MKKILFFSIKHLFYFKEWNCDSGNKTDKTENESLLQKEQIGK